MTIAVNTKNASEKMELSEAFFLLFSHLRIYVA